MRFGFPSDSTLHKLRTALITVVVLLMALAFVLIDRSGSILTGSLTDIGTKGGRTVTQISFDPAETSEVLPVDHLNIILIPDTADISDSAPLSTALTQGKRIFGYKYSSRDASAEIAAQARAENGEPLTYSELFPGQFFVSDEQRRDSTFITDFETEKNITFLPLPTITLNRNARYVIVTEDEGTTFTIGGLLGFCGLGTFFPKTDYPSLHESIAFSLVDVNGDGVSDVIQVNAAQQISTHFGNANGTFASAVEGRLGFFNNYFSAFAFGDLNGDDRADIVATDHSSTFILIGHGDGTFDEPTNIHNVGGALLKNNILITDIDNDGDNDVIHGSINLTVFRNDGIGNFSQYQNYASPGFGWITSIDIDADGDRDIVANSGSDGLVFLNNGDGTLSPFQIYGGGVYPSSFAIADFNGDHALDIFSVRGDVNSPEARTGVRFGNGDGTFGTYDDAATSVKQKRSLVTADFNGDGMADIARATEENNSLSILLGSSNRISNRVSQLFDVGSSYTTGLIPRFLAIADINGDNAFDLVTSNYGSSTISVFLGTRRDTPFCPAEH